MPGLPSQTTAANRRQRAGTAFLLGLCIIGAPACKTPPTATKPSSAQAADALPQLASARLELARLRVADHAPDEALGLVLAALEADPQAAAAMTMAAAILTKTRWHLPELSLDHRLPIERIDYAAPASLWVCLNGATTTSVRWNLDTLQIAGILFPLKAPGIRSLVFDASHKTVVIERAGTTLLCNAQTLKPICNLGPLPDFLTPSAVVVFSADGLLLAHPSWAAENDRSLVWHLRDSATGGIIRSSDPIPPDHPPPLAAALDRQHLRVLNADASLLDIPLSPAVPVTLSPPVEALTLRHGQFAANGGSALALQDLGPHRRPELLVVPLGGPDDSSLQPTALLERYPWSLQPGLWCGLLRDAPQAPLQVDELGARFLTDQYAPLHATSAITAVALSGERLLVAETTGRLTIYRTLPVPLVIPATARPANTSPQGLVALRNLTTFLTGITFDAGGRPLTSNDLEHRLQAFKNCDFTALRGVFPTLDFSPVIAARQAFQPRTAAPDALLPLWDRLAQADPSGATWPMLLEKSGDLTKTAWHQELTAAALARSSSAPGTLASSPWLAARRIAQVFAGNDPAAIEAAIKTSGGKGPAAATALELALASDHPEWIEACLATAVDLPPMLRRLASSRSAWLQHRKADALAGWPDVLPDLEVVRTREDWAGWEQADYSAALAQLRRCISEELTSLEVPTDATPAQRQAIATRLNDPITLQAIGRARLAKACLQAALALASCKDATATTCQLAARARELGADPAPCLRAEAIALTSLGNYQQAHNRWITLITEHPLASQQPGDYAEAAYTSFENSDPRQAMAVLTTGLHRFPNDANFALRAGWVALLTGNAERAYRFLLSGRQIGFPPEKLENATALLAIAAAQTGAAEDAAAFYQDLIRLDPAWQNPATLESLEWPEELKASLRQLVW